MEQNDMEDLREYLEAVSNDFQKLLNSGLKEETIVLLLHDSSKVSKPKIRMVLKAAKELKQKYLAPVPGKLKPTPTPTPSVGKTLSKDDKSGEWMQGLHKGK